MNETYDSTVRESRLPEVWPGWETVDELGKGSFGAVYKIWRNTMGYEEYAAVKHISIPSDSTEITGLRKNGYDDESITENFREQGKRLLQEYALMRSLNGHTNIVSCDDVRSVSHEEGFGMDLYIKMELLTPLENRNSADFTDSEVIKLGVDLCQALELCEKNKIIHRDIKPANIFISKNGDYKLGDFGVSRILEGNTGADTVTGTPRFMAPEVYGNQSYNHTVDIYSLGLVLYWLLNERRTPFQALPPAKLSYSGDQDAISRRMKGEVIPEPKNGSEALKKIVLKACAYDPKERYQTAAEMKKALETLNPPTSELKKKLWLLTVIPMLALVLLFARGGKNEQKPAQESGAKTAAPNADPVQEYSFDDQLEYEYDTDGNVKTEYEYDADGNKIKQNKYNTDDSVDYWFETDEYSTNGKLKRETKYRADGSVDCWVEVDGYDAKGNRIRDTSYNADGSVMSSFKYEYDANGNLIMKYEYDADGGLVMKYEYNSDGKTTKRTRYNADGSVGHWFETNEYDANGNEKRVTKCKADGSTDYWYEFEYDANGNRTKRTAYRSSGVVWIDREYDLNGTVVRKQTLYSSNSNHTKKYEYVADGNSTKQILYDTNGSVKNWYEFEYDADGKLQRLRKYRADGSVEKIYENDDVGAGLAGLSTIPSDAVRFGGHYYKVFPFDAVFSWEAAKSFCESKGGYLAVISSEEENMFLNALVFSSGVECAYFGYSDAEEESVWKWLTDEESDYANWRSGEPNGFGSKENYAEFYWKYENGSWNDGNFEKEITLDINAFICEWNPIHAK